MRILSLLLFVLLHTACGSRPPSSQELSGLPGALTSTSKIVTARDGRVVEVESGTLQSTGASRAPVEPGGNHSLLPTAVDLARARHPDLPARWRARVLLDRPDRERGEFRRGCVLPRDRRRRALRPVRGRALNAAPSLRSAHRVPADEPLRISALADAIREAAGECRDAWTTEGVDLSAYTTVENAADVDALRAALGYDRVTLIGGSYGSHLALALMRYHPESIERVVLHGVEGLDHTWDSPAGRLAVLRRHAEAAEASGAFGRGCPKGGCYWRFGR